MDIRLHVIENITNNFSPDLKIGSGGYGDVYKGVLCDAELIAVKLLHDLVEGHDDKLFKNEVGNLLAVDHPNIVQFLGYCYETQSKYVKYNGENVFGKHIRRVLCFEYLHGGSLDKRLAEKSFAPHWSARYNIIKGICEGLNFLHGHGKPIFHLDLKPGNILLDRFMVPKLADFGLSRLIGESHTHVTQKRIGTDKYMPPEYKTGGKISEKNDIFSLGVVMIEIMEGPEGYCLFQEIDDAAQFKRVVLTKWSDMIEPTSAYRSEKLCQVETCINIAMNCVDSQRKNRHTIECILDILNKTETGIPKTKIADVPEYLTIDLKNSLAKTIKMLTPDMDNISNLVSNMEQVSYIRGSSPNVEESLIIGRNEEKQKILSILSKSSTNEMVILPIYGIGGIGKTTLAKLVFSDKEFNGFSRVWVKVSKTLDLNKIGNSIITLLTNKISDIANDQMLNNHLAMLLAFKSIIIVLDDLWENDACKLDELKAMLRLGQGRKIILVTTRDEAIARNICNTVENVSYKLDILTDDMCWTIIKQKSCFEDRHDKTHLVQIGRDIAIKCGGVALAAQSLGYMLRDMTFDQWESVRDNDIWNLSISEDPSLRIHEVLASLRLSYSHMHQWLQSCFSYCAMFRKGRSIAKHDLIHQWIALEFIEPSQIFDSMQLCEKYITHLLGLSFLQFSTRPWDECGDEYMTWFMMHDLVHDLATATLADKVNKNGNDIGSSCQYALVREPSKPLHVKYPENLKALHFLARENIELSDGVVSPAKCLHILDIRGWDILKLPGSIGQLKQLGYLHSPRIQDQMIPSCITELSKLNYLNLGNSEIEALPDSIGDVKGLMYLDLSGCGKLSKLPLSFGDLKQLVHLNLSHCHVPISGSWGGFTKLQYLNLSSWGSFPELQYSNLISFRYPQVQRIKQCDFKVLLEVIGKLTKLQYLNLSSSIWPGPTKVLPNLEVFGKLTRLRYLNLSWCLNRMSEADCHRLLVGIRTCYNLEHLDLCHSNQLNSIPESIDNLKKLHTLDLFGCNIQKLPAWMAKMATLKFVYMTTFDECTSNIIMFAAANPQRLKIRNLEDLKSLEEAQSVKLIDKRRLHGLELEWTVGCHKRSVDDKDVLEILVPNTISTLNITGYMSLSFPANWLMDIGQYLRIVQSLNLSDFPNCNNLPPLGQLPHLEVLSLCRLGRLEELNTADSCGELMFPKLYSVSIISCPKLRIKQCVPRALSNFYIEGSDNVLTSVGKSVSQTGASTSYSLGIRLNVKGSAVPLCQWSLLPSLDLRVLVVTNCNDLTSCSPGVTRRLSSLESLELKDDITLTKLPTWLLELPSLKYLALCGCRSLPSLPRWLGELTSLRLLRITGCEGIRSLPGSIRQLTELDTLKIDSNLMSLNDIRKMLSSISADTDELNIDELLEEFGTKKANGPEGLNFSMDRQDTYEYSGDEESVQKDIEEDEEDAHGHPGVHAANAAAALVRSPSGENMSGGGEHSPVFDPPDDDAYEGRAGVRHTWAFFLAFLVLFCTRYLIG